jgi:hypothetical protein
MGKKTASQHHTLASKTLRDGRSARTAAGSALTQRPVSKQGSISLKQANTAVRSYLMSKKK